MKRIFKAFVIVGLNLLLCACNNTAKGSVEKYLNNYINLSSVVMDDMQEVINKENLNDENKKTYEEVFKRAYQALMYDIAKEEYNGNNAIISVNIKVLDLYKVQKEATEYLKNHEDRFYNENQDYDVQKYLKYKLEMMLSTTDTIEYTIDFYVVKENNKWEVTPLANSDIEKIHGIYNYES